MLRIAKPGGTMKRRLLCVAFILTVADVHAQAVRLLTPTTSVGERVVRVEATVRQPPEQVWKSFVTAPGLKCWVAPVIALDLRTGGTLSTNYDKAGSIGGPGTIRLKILNYVENEVMTFGVELNDQFSSKLQAEDERLQEIIQLQRLPDGGTRIVSNMVGWGTGADWDKAYKFFASGNKSSYEALAKCLGGGKS
jgi:uncharacterized protein YndB with AHSA1/START domain